MPSQNPPTRNGAGAGPCHAGRRRPHHARDAAPAAQPGDSTPSARGEAPFNRADGDAVYARLRRLAGIYLAREQQGHTLQPTALVHEAYLRMGTDAGAIADLDASTIIGRAARVMRQVLVDHARRKRAQRRSATGERLPLDETLACVERSVTDLLALHEALTHLAAIDERLASVVELRFFAGLSIDEAAVVLGMSRSSVDRSWRLARLWLFEALAGDDRDGR